MPSEIVPSDPQPRQLSLFDPIEIPLTKGYVALVDPIDADLARYKWSVHEINGKLYTHRSPSKGQRLSIHRVVLERILNRALLTGEECDHIDGNPLNNCRANLRVATHSQNMKNKRKYRCNTSGYKGVSWYKPYSKWRAKIQRDGKTIHLGYFDNAEDAYRAYCSAALKYHGEFARFE